MKEPVYTVLVDSAALYCSVSLLWLGDLVVKRAILHGLRGGADPSGNVVVEGLRCGADVVHDGRFGRSTEIIRDRGVGN